MTLPGQSSRADPQQLAGTQLFCTSHQSGCDVKSNRKRRIALLGAIANCIQGPPAVTAVRTVQYAQPSFDGMNGWSVSIFAESPMEGIFSLVRQTTDQLPSPVVPLSINGVILGSNPRT
jgi:hypothetical protein